MNALEDRMKKLGSRGTIQLKNGVASTPGAERKMLKDKILKQSKRYLISTPIGHWPAIIIAKSIT